MFRKSARIIDSYLGYVTGKTLTAWLLMDFGGGLVRAIGGGYLASDDIEANERYGEDFVLRLVKVYGAERWPPVAGTSLEVLFEADSVRSAILGVAGPDDRLEDFLFDELTLEMDV